jgi:AraC family transcriptional regulator
MDVANTPVANASRSTISQFRGPQTRNQQSVVKFDPPDIARRRIASWNGIRADAVEVTRREPFECGLTSPYHVLVATERGERDDGETVIEGGQRSTLREFSHKLSFVPAGHRFYGWQRPRALARATYLYIDPAGLLVDPELQFSEIEFRPRLYFDDNDIWSTVLKIKAQIDQPDAGSYAEALSVVLAHELARSNNGGAAERSLRGGLAGWQQRKLTDYVEDRLAEQITLADLAGVAQLSPFHFARAFKQSFGLPPHRYHMGRRIERAKTLLENPARSVTEIAAATGFAETSSFTVAFRRSVGMTPTDYRRGID